ncbi:MAG: HEAT repeat domain-containing protein, partial [Sedimentisphaerales bacterium]
RLWLWEKALLKMGPGVVEPLIALMDDESTFIREKVAGVLSRQADPRAKDVLLRALDDKSRFVREYAMGGLMRLGPEVVGQDKLVAILVSGLKDGAPYPSIPGLKQYGDERAIEPLRVIEQFDTVRNHDVSNTDGLRMYAYEARLAINAILSRAGKPVTEVSREHYSKALSREELIAAAQCPHAGIRKIAVTQLDQYPDERTALFLMERIKEEKNPDILHRIRMTLYWTMMISPDNSSRRVVLPEVMQKVFDAELAVVETIWTSNLIVSRDGESAFSADVDLEHLAEKIATATLNADMILIAASHRKVPLENINRFKRAVRRNLQVKELRKFEELMRTCYDAISSIAGLPPETGQAWSPQEKLELQQQLAPLLYSPNPQVALIGCLGCIGDNRLSPRLIELLAHNNWSTRHLAAFALGNIGDPNALPALQHLAETDPYQHSEDSYPVRRSAKEAIKKIQEKQAGMSAAPSLGAEPPPLEFESSVDAVPERISEVFQRADNLWEEMKQRSREYLSSMSDEELAKVYGKHSGRPLASSLPEIEQKRAEIIGKLVEHGYYWSKQDREFNDLCYEQLVNGLAALGPKALPEFTPYMRKSYIAGGKPTLIVRALCKMGPEVVEPLLELLDTQDDIPKENIIHVLLRSADARAKDVFLRNLYDGNGLVRERSLRGLARLGPDIVGKEKLNTLLVDRLQDKACLGAAIWGLSQHGDESAIEPLLILERSQRAKGEEGISRMAIEAVEKIRRRQVSLSQTPPTSSGEGKR